MRAAAAPCDSGGDRPRQRRRPHAASPRGDGAVAAAGCAGRTGLAWSGASRPVRLSVEASPFGLLPAPATPPSLKPGQATTMGALHEGHDRAIRGTWDALMGRA